MLSYELIKQLRDANFPLDWYLYGKPNLSQLIEACGDIQFDLSCTRNGYCVWHQRKQGKIFKTPEEAIAKLWLKLHETNTKNKE